MNAWDTMRAAVNEAETTLRAADRYADELAAMLAPRIRHARDVDDLRTLKRALRDFDMTTGKWKR